MQGDDVSALTGLGVGSDRDAGHHLLGSAPKVVDLDEVDQRRADGQRVSGLELARQAHPFAVDERAVRAAKIFDPGPPEVLEDAGVLARDSGVREDDVVVLIPPDANDRLDDDVLLPFAVASSNEQLESDSTLRCCRT